MINICTILNAQRNFIQKKKEWLRETELFLPMTKWSQTVLGVLISTTFCIFAFRNEKAYNLGRFFKGAFINHVNMAARGEKELTKYVYYNFSLIE